MTPAEVGSNEKTSEEAVSRIAVLARELHEAMSDVVWSINPVNASIESFIQRSRKYLNEVCEARGISISFESDEKVLKTQAPPELLHNLLLIIKEAITNIVRHAGCSQARVRIRDSDGNIYLDVWDNGCGFDNGSRMTGNGLRNMSRRAEQLGGTMAVQSAKTNGTTLSFSIPKKKNRTFV